MVNWNDRNYVRAVGDIVDILHGNDFSVEDVLKVAQQVSETWHEHKIEVDDEPLFEPRFVEDKVTNLNDYRINRGDTVVLEPAEPWNSDWTGLRVIVLDKSVNAHGNVLVQPLDKRPDGYEHQSFYWPVRDFRKVN